MTCANKKRVFGTTPEEVGGINQSLSDVAVDAADDELPLEREKEMIIKDFMSKNPNLYEMCKTVLLAMAALPPPPMAKVITTWRSTSES